MDALSLDGYFWRRMARFGARGPEWFARFAPPLIGVAICAMAPAHRRAIARNLRRMRGRRGAIRDACDVARTFATYASCLTEVLGGADARGRAPEALIWGELHVDDALADGRGVLFATAHTAGWEAFGPLLWRDRRLRVLVAEARERNEAARTIQDEARREQGLVVTHVGDDPLSGLPLLKHLRKGGVVALQIDRVPAGARARRVSMFGGPGRVPEGPLRLASITGAPILPVFTARTGHRRYEVVVHSPLRVARRPSEAELDAAAQAIADGLQQFVLAHPTQWFHFREQ
jgi:KDO2-lipid IV(A) lauroyltransferase